MQPAAPSDPQPSRIEVCGYDLAASVEGSGPAIVAVPGLPGSSRDFRWLAPELARWSQVLRFDPPGYGASRRPQFTPMAAQEKADILLALLDHFGLPQVVLLGHSFGCVVSAIAAQRQPDRVSHLLLLAPPGVRARYPVGMVRAGGGLLQQQRGRRLLAGLQRRVYSSAGFPSFLSDDELAMTSLDSGAADFDGYRRALAAAPQPTLIAWAMDDRQVPPASAAGLHRYAAAGPRIAFATGGHNIQKSRAVELAGFIRSFLGR